MHSTLNQRIEALAASVGDRSAIIEPNRSMSYSELRDQVQNLAGYFVNLGVKADDRVALWLPNIAQWVTCFLALSRIGAITLSVNTRFRSHELEDLIVRGQATWLIYWPQFKGIAFDEILADIPSASTAKLKGKITLDEINAASQGSWPLVADHGDHGTLTFTTSGTTSLPKFVLHTESTILLHADAVSQAFAYDEKTRVLASAPFCGAFGFATLSGGLFCGHPVVCEAVSTPQSLLALIRQEQVTHTYANNSLLLDIFMSSDQPQDFSSCRLFGFASFAPASGALFELAQRSGVKLCGLYGSSELQALTAAQPDQATLGDTSLVHEPGGCLVHPHARVRARDPETGHILTHKQSGEIEILTPSRMSGYLDNPQASHNAFTEDGYFKTGDLGWCASDRQFVFQTRMGDSLRLGGFLVSPAEIEDVIENLAGIQAAQVVSVDHANKAVAVAFVILKPGAVADPESWRTQCKRLLAGFKVPVHFEVVDQFPSVESANSTKIQKHKLREMAQEILEEQRDA